MSKIKFKIVTPERVVYENDVDQATIPTTGGQITVLPNHIPLMSLLLAGELLLKKNQEDIPIAVSSGFIQVNNNEIVILADTAERAEEIDEARAEEARVRAQKLMQEVKNKEDVQYTALVAKMEREVARLNVARRRRHHPQHPGIRQ